jgi:hypothetical protein
VGGLLCAAAHVVETHPLYDVDTMSARREVVGPWQVNGIDALHATYVRSPTPFPMRVVAVRQFGAKEESLMDQDAGLRGASLSNCRSGGDGPPFSSASRFARTSAAISRARDAPFSLIAARRPLRFAPRPDARPPRTSTSSGSSACISRAPPSAIHLS